MLSISHAITAVDVAHVTIQQSKNSGKFATTPDEVSKSRVAKAKAMQALDQSISVVGSTLEKLRGSISAKHEANSTKSPISKNMFVPSLVQEMNPDIPNGLSVSHASNGINATNGAHVVDDLNGSPQNPAARGSAATPGDKVKELIHTMSAEPGDALNPTLATTVPTLNEMALSIAPIIDNFNEVLKKPYLNEFNASLNTVPVVGLKNQTVMYVERKLGGTPLGPPVDQWSVFSSLPDGVTAGPDDNFHFFPYKADFYMSIGSKVWLKRHRQGPSPGNTGDPLLAKAVNNWPFMYNTDWEYVGESVLPAADLVEVLPFAVLSADRTQIDFQLVVMGTDSSLQVLDGDTLQAQNKWAPMVFQSSAGSVPQPKWKLMAYWNNHFVAYDDDQHFWNLQPNWATRTYTAKDMNKIPEPIIAMTATEEGPICVRADGILWKRVVEPPRNDTDPGSYAWRAWIRPDGVTKIGVASPGVLLDLNLLTKTLQTRYIDTQLAVLPLMNKLRAFGNTHKRYLTDLKAASDTWNNNPENPDKQKEAIKQGRGFVQHAVTWARIMENACKSAQGPINDMSSQLSDVEKQLEVQLTILQDKLAGLQATLKVQEEYLTGLQAGFWSSVAAIFLGIVVAVVAAVTLNPWVIAAAGGLLVGGILGAALLGQKMMDASQAVSTTKSQILTTQTAIGELTTIVSSFRDLNKLYSILNTFFGRMTLDADVLKTMDDVTAELLGDDTLSDPSSIEAAMDMTDDMTNACTTYADVLASQGIILPDGTLSIGKDPASMKLLAKARSLDETFHNVVTKATDALDNGDKDKYFKLLTAAFVIHQSSISTQHFSDITSGLWFDVPTLNSSGVIWAGFKKGVNIQGKHAFDISTEVFESIDSLEGSLNFIRPEVIALLSQTARLANSAKSWADKYPTMPTTFHMRDAQTYQNSAIDACQKAQDAAFKAKNAFIDFNHQAQMYQQGLENQATECGGKIHSGHIAYNLNSVVSHLKNYSRSGLTFEKHTKVWQKMVRTVGHDLGLIYNILTGIEGQVMENSYLYSQLMEVEWSVLANNANDVLTILGAHSPATSLTVHSKAVQHLQHIKKSTTAAKSIQANNKKLLLEAFSSNPHLGLKLTTQVKECESAFKSINIVLGLPYSTDIVAYWDEKKTEKATLFDIATKLRNEYVGMVVMEYQTVEQLYSLAILQGQRAENVKNGRITLQVFINNTVTSLRAALKAAQSASGEFQASSGAFDQVVVIIQKNIDEIAEKIKKINENIDLNNKALRDKIIWEVADTVAIVFSTAALIASLGASSAVVAVVTTATRLGLGAAAIASGIKLVIDSLDLDELIKTIQALKQSRTDLQTSLENLTAVKPFFEKVVTGVDALASTVDDMALSIQIISDNVDLWKETTLTTEDVTTIHDSWIDIQNDCLNWMDMVHSQGINPVTKSLEV